MTDEYGNNPTGSTQKIEIPLNGPGIPIFENPVHEILSPKMQKHEEIKQKAWDLFVKYLTSDFKLKVNGKSLVKTKDFIRFSWGRAEEFHEYAKKKEDEA